MPTRFRLAASIAATFGTALAAAVAPAAIVEPSNAEFAIRWNAADGGPATAEAAMAILAIHARHAKRFRVDYYDLPPTMAAPPGFAAILRRRASDGDSDVQRAEVTFKLRGELPLSQWTCPWRNADPPKAEVDFTLGMAGASSRSYSYSCSRDDADIAAAELSATRKSCGTSVRRWERGRVKVEEWQLPGDILMIEVSGTGRNTDKALENFRRQVAVPLLEAGAVPSPSSKTDLGSLCAR